MNCPFKSTGRRDEGRRQLLLQMETERLTRGHAGMALGPVRHRKMLVVQKDVQIPRHLWWLARPHSFGLSLPVYCGWVCSLTSHF